MPLYRHPEASGDPNEITVIENREMFTQDKETGAIRPGFEFINSHTITRPTR